jgi:hypothetical protein
MRRLTLLFALPLLLISEEGMPAPSYTGKDRLIRPQGYREWMFVGANLGMGYTEGQQNPKQNYHNIYMQREAYKQYVATGKFPDKTMLVMEVLSPGTKESINRNGSFEDKSIGIEVALKDETRFPDKWAYFNFIGEGGKPLPDSGAFKKEQCWNCHNQHGAKDNVFLQFYPALRDAR